MIRRMIGMPFLALVLVACGDSDVETSQGSGTTVDDELETSTTSTTQAGPSELTVHLVARSVRGGSPTFARNTADTECGVRYDGSPTGFDTSGELSVTDRAGTVLGVADIPPGDVTDLQLTEDGSYLSQECTITIEVELFEESEDLTLFEFRWEDTDLTISEQEQLSGSEVTFEVEP